LFTITKCAEQTKRFQMQWKKDFQRVGEGLSEMAKSLEIDERRAVTNIFLSNSVGQAAGVLFSIGQMVINRNVIGYHFQFDYISIEVY